MSNPRKPSPEIAARLETIRTWYNLTDEVFAERLSVVVDTYRKYSAAELEVPSSVLDALFSEFDVDPRWVLRGGDEGQMHNWSNDPPQTLGMRFLRLRKRENLTQTEFAQKVGTSQSAYATYEGDQRDPPSRVVAAACLCFKVDPAWLLLGLEDRTDGALAA